MHAGELDRWHAAAKEGAAWAVEKLLECPTLPPEAMPYWAAFTDLDRDRPKNKIGGGMMATVDLPDPIPLDRIRSEGARLGYDGEGLEDFTEILRRLDDEFVRVNSLRIAAEVRAGLERARQRNRR